MIDNSDDDMLLRFTLMIAMLTLINCDAGVDFESMIELMKVAQQHIVVAVIDSLFCC